jgi:hypothetical protein
LFDLSDIYDINTKLDKTLFVIGTEMRNVIELKKGETFFHVAFFDKELSIPTIETYIYMGEDEQDENQVLFMGAECFVRGNEGLDNDEIYYITYAKDNIFSIVDKEHLIGWLKREHSPRLVATEYEYKFL